MLVFLLPKTMDDFLEKKIEDMDEVWLENYPSGVGRQIEFERYPLYRVLTRSAREYPDKEALVFYGQSYSFKKIDEQSSRFASVLQKQGVRKGDRVTLFLPNCPAFVIAFYGALKAGAIVSPLNPLYTAKELAEIVNDSGSRVIVSLKIFSGKIAKVQGKTELETVILSNIGAYLPSHLSFLNDVKNFPQKILQGPQRVQLKRNGSLDFEEVIEGSDKEYSEVETASDDIAVLMYTSGTTGLPKGVPLTHFNITANLDQIGAFVDGAVSKAQEVQLGVLPFFHIYGLTFVLNHSMREAWTVILFPKFHTKTICQAIGEHEITIVPGVPAIFSALCNLIEKNPEQFDISSIRFCGSGAASCPAELLRRVKKVTGKPIIEAYGLTETSPITHMNPPLGKQKTGSIGIPLPGTEAKIVHPQTGEELPALHSGELMVKGPQVFEGYWGKQDVTDEALEKEGWLHTKDIVLMDTDGYFFIQGRLDDMINVSGQKVWPKEIEDVLSEHPAVKEAAVVGVEDEKTGQAPKAFVVLDKKIEKEEILDFCREKLVGYKIPKGIEEISEVPRSHLGKNLRYILRKEAQEKS